MTVQFLKKGKSTMRLALSISFFVATIHLLSFGMENADQEQKTAPSSLSGQLENLSIAKNQEERLLITKEHVDKKRTEFIAYVKRTKKHIKNPISAVGIKLASKMFEKKRQKKENASEPTSFLGVKGAEPNDIHFLNTFLAKEHKKTRENSLKEFGTPEDLKRIHEILKAVEALTAEQVEEQRIAILHKHVVIYLKEQEGTTKAALREKVQKGQIAQDLYFKATTMSLFGAFVLEDKLPKK